MFEMYYHFPEKHQGLYYLEQIVLHVDFKGAV